MTPTEEKLEEVYINFKGSYNLPLLSDNVYMAILICKKI